MTTTPPLPQDPPSRSLDQDFTKALIPASARLVPDYAALCFLNHSRKRFQPSSARSFR